MVRLEDLSEAQLVQLHDIRGQIVHVWRAFLQEQNATSRKPVVMPVGPVYQTWITICNAACSVDSVNFAVELDKRLDTIDHAQDTAGASLAQETAICEQYADIVAPLRAHHKQLARCLLNQTQTDQVWQRWSLSIAGDGLAAATPLTSSTAVPTASAPNPEGLFGGYCKEKSERFATASLEDMLGDGPGALRWGGGDPFPVGLFDAKKNRVAVGRPAKKRRRRSRSSSCLDDSGESAACSVHSSKDDTSEDEILLEEEEEDIPEENDVQSETFLEGEEDLEDASIFDEDSVQTSVEEEPVLGEAQAKHAVDIW